MKKAATLDMQVALLKARGVRIDNEAKAKECLLDIGYFRLCSYLFPFEKSYPKFRNRSHDVIDGTSFSDAVTLYYFDFELRVILTRYITRIEVAIRTYITYTISNKYLNSPTWFVDPNVMMASYISDFDSTYDLIKKKQVIRRHHHKYINDRYAPAWKTIEYMTFGNVESLYKALKSPVDKIEISRHFGVNQTAIFENYLEVIRSLRNTCAHGGVLFDIRLALGIKTGPAGKMTDRNKHNLCGALNVVEYILGTISQNRLKDMRNALGKVLGTLYSDNPNLENIIKNTSGLLHYEK